MKLGDFKGEKAIEVIADLIEPITNIAEDQGNLQLFHAKRQEGESDREMAVRDFKTKIPLLLKTHKKDILTILSVINDIDAEKISLMDIIKGTNELLNDKDFMSLFFSSVSQTGRTSPTESSADADLLEPES